MIGKGVRFNAEKKKCGNYYSTPLYSFSMKCPTCSGIMVIETDPKNCDYKLVSGTFQSNQTSILNFKLNKSLSCRLDQSNILSGVRRKEERWVPEEAGGIPQMLSDDSKKLAADAMFRSAKSIPSRSRHSHRSAP